MLVGVVLAVEVLVIKLLVVLAVEVLVIKSLVGVVLVVEVLVIKLLVGVELLAGFGRLVVVGSVLVSLMVEFLFSVECKIA